jgi:hypothetical protein
LICWSPTVWTIALTRMSAMITAPYQAFGGVVDDGSHFEWPLDDSR